MTPNIPDLSRAHYFLVFPKTRQIMGSGDKKNGLATQEEAELLQQWHEAHGERPVVIKLSLVGKKREN